METAVSSKTTTAADFEALANAARSVELLTFVREIGASIVATKVAGMNNTFPVLLRVVGSDQTSIAQITFTNPREEGSKSPLPKFLDAVAVGSDFNSALYSLSAALKGMWMSMPGLPEAKYFRDNEEIAGEAHSIVAREVTRLKGALQVSRLSISTNGPISEDEGVIASLGMLRNFHRDQAIPQAPRLEDASMPARFS